MAESRKKYQWIALYRLLGHLADNLPDSRDRQPTIEPLIASSLRNIDCTHDTQEDSDHQQPSWWFPQRYDFAASESVQENEWLDAYGDFPLSAEILTCTKSNQRDEWILLGMWSDQTSRTADWKEPYRRISLAVRSFFVRQDDRDRFWAWLRRQDLMGHRPLHDPKALPYELMIGEYPWAPSCAEFLDRPDFDDWRGGLPCAVWSAGFDRAVSFEYDAYQNGSIMCYCPNPMFFQHSRLTWNGESGYEAEDGDLVLDSPSICTPGPLALLVKRPYLEDFLAARQLATFWTMTSERMVLGDYSERDGGYAQKFRSHFLSAGKVRSSKERVFRITPGQRVELKAARRDSS